jgi:hypothetical protein
VCLACARPSAWSPELTNKIGSRAEVGEAKLQVRSAWLLSLLTQVVCVQCVSFPFLSVPPMNVHLMVSLSHCLLVSICVLVTCLRKKLAIYFLTPVFPSVIYSRVHFSNRHSIETMWGGVGVSSECLLKLACHHLQEPLQWTWYPLNFSPSQKASIKTVRSDLCDFHKESSLRSREPVEYWYNSFTSFLRLLLSPRKMLRLLHTFQTTKFVQTSSSLLGNFLSCVFVCVSMFPVFVIFLNSATCNTHWTPGRKQIILLKMC